MPLRRRNRVVYPSSQRAIQSIHHLSSSHAPSNLTHVTLVFPSVSSETLPATHIRPSQTLSSSSASSSNQPANGLLQHRPQEVSPHLYLFTIRSKQLQHIRQFPPPSGWKNKYFIVLPVLHSRTYARACVRYARQMQGSAWCF